MKIIYTLLIVALFTACEKTKPEDLTLCNTSHVTYANFVNKLVYESCGSLSTGCHAQVNRSITFPTFNTKEDCQKYAGQMYLSITRNRGDKLAMPLGGTGLSECEILKFKAWIDQGKN